MQTEAIAAPIECPIANTFALGCLARRLRTDAVTFGCKAELLYEMKKPAVNASPHHALGGLLQIAIKPIASLHILRQA